LWELRPSYPFYSLEEAEVDKYIHVARSFAPHQWAILVRIFFLFWSLQVLYTDVSAYPPHNLYIYMGYLTHWGHLLSNLYFLCSLLCCIVPNAVEQPSDKAQPPGRLVRLTWGLFSCVAPLQISIAILYWSGTAFISGYGCYICVMEHGGIAALVLIDGFLVGLVPIRAKHIIFLVMVSLLYLCWSIVDAVLEIGNGEWGPAYEDDAFYPVLNWNDDRRGATIVSSFVICVFSPGIFYACWLMSLSASCCVSSGGSIKVLKCQEEEEDVHTMHKSSCCCPGSFDGSRRPLFTYQPDDNDITTDPMYKNMEDNKEMV